VCEKGGGVKPPERPLNVVEVATNELAGMAAPYNPRKISDHYLEALRRSLRFVGTAEPIIVNERSGHIVGGHQRVKAAESEGLESLPVVHVDLDEPNEKQLNIALNKDYVAVDAVLAAVAARPARQHVVITGRGAPQALVEAADTVTEMRMVKHAFKAGIKAQNGIEL